MASDAVGSERVSAVVGYKITKGNFSNTTPNLPQRIALIGEANTANQSTLSLTPKEITSAKQAGDLYGYGSPLHMAMRILRPSNGGGIGGIPVYVYPQAEASGAGTQSMDITPSGVATGSGTHTIIVAGRGVLDGDRYDISVEEGDTASDITDKIADAINNVLGCPFTATNTDYDATLVSKWRGATAAGLTLSVDTNDDDLGLSYAVTTNQSGIGTPDIDAALDLFQNDWNTLVINTYGTNTSVMDSLEAFNGIPDPTTPTGRFAGIVMKPFIALTGSTVENPSTITDSREDDVTIAICPAPLSPGHHLEAAANMAVLFARKAQDAPHGDIQNSYYPDMPVPDDGVIGAMSDYENRDSYVKKGCSTVDFTNGKYQIKDFVTTYHPTGENPPAYRYCRNIMVDLNVYFGYYLLEQAYVVGKTVASDSDTVNVTGVIKPAGWKGIVRTYFDSLASRALITDTDFSKESLEVDLSSTNPDRLETFFRYKRTGVARIASTTAEAGFNFGS